MKKLLYIILFATSLFPTSLFTQWVQQTVPVTKPITGIKFINANTGWALSSSTSGIDTCHILYTSNGGTNWVIQYTATSSMFLALSVIDANIVYAGGISSGATANLHKTTNGGVNWSLIPTPTNMSILNMQFLNKDSGWTVGGSIGADVRTTTNGGVNWIVRTSGISAQTQRIFFLNYNTGFCGANFFLYKTTDAGLNWIQLYNPVNSLYSIYFINESTGWLGLNNNQIHFTSNGGINWLNQSVPLVNSQPIQDIYFINSQTGWGGRGSSNIYVTTNGGTNWGYQIVSTGTSRISFIDAQTGWGAIFGISKTTNNGGTIFYSGFESSGTTVPNSFKLYQNYPNPFNPTTTIKVDVHKLSEINFIIFDILGKILHQENEQLSAGSYEFKWDASKYSSGIYFYKFITGGHTETKKMLLMK